MAYPQVLIPPSVRPVTPVPSAPVDDQTVEFRPRFARGATQRQVWGDPLWSFQTRYQGLAQADRALLKSAVARARGKAANVLWTPGLPLRGSFPASELLTNGDFSNGTAGHSGEYSTLSVADRILRVTNTKGGGVADFGVYQTGITVTQYGAYCLRSFIASVSRSGMSNGVYLNSTPHYATDGSGMISQASTFLSSSSGTVYLAVIDANGNIGLAGDFAELSYSSLARCLLIDNGPNALLQSQTFQTTWSVTRSTITANSVAAPDGTTTADTLNEDGTAATTHFVSQDATVSSSASDYSFSCYVKKGTRSWVRLTSTESTAGHQLSAYFNVDTGVVGTVSVTGANWTNERAHIVDAGSGSFRCIVSGRKASAGTTLTCSIFIGEADSDVTFDGLSAASLYIWGASLAQSSVPVRYVATTSASTAGTSQTGRNINVKGLPASTDGLLLAGDYIEINGQLERCVAPLNSDAAGLGVLSIGRTIFTPPSDNDPGIVMNPFGRFTIKGVREVERFGVYTDVELDLEESQYA